MIEINQQQWQEVNNQLNAKIISELHYEELLELNVKDTVSNTQESKSQVKMTQKKTVCYQWNTAKITWEFQAKKHIWGNIIIDDNSLSRNGEKNINTAELLKDIANDIKLDNIILGNLIEEIQQTLYADLQSMKSLKKYTGSALLNLSGVALQAVLKGHPKALANKGRLGWGTSELAQYAPEYGQHFQLHFIAIKKTLTTIGIERSLKETHYQTLVRMLTELMSPQQMEGVFKTLEEQHISLEKYWIIPTHPWQFQHYITSQFTALLADKSIIDLGITGDYYQAQQSIRTLSNITRPKRNDVKLPITILNTSCYRGIPGKYITSGAELSKFIQQRCDQDSFLKKSNFKVLKEWAGIHVTNPNQVDIKQTPYRYNEMLGVILRQSPAAILAENQQDKLAAALMQNDANGHSLIAQYIEASGLDINAWLTKLFDSTVIPLYHLMCQYGIALVSHGQNLTLLMENHTPVGLAIKDFHGDLRIVDEDFPEHAELPTHIAQQLTKLPAQYLLHDLYTGHFVTVLRFVSPLLEDQLDYSEHDFYQLLSQRIVKYQAQFPALAIRFKQFDLLAEKVEKICINRVRFNIGYQDTSERLLPVLGQPLNNPLFPDTVLTS